MRIIDADKLHSDGFLGGEGAVSITQINKAPNPLKEVIEKLEEISDNLSNMDDELYMKRDACDRIEADTVLDVTGMYLNEFWEEMDEIIRQLKGEG